MKSIFSSLFLIISITIYSQSIDVNSTSNKQVLLKFKDGKTLEKKEYKDEIEFELNENRIRLGSKTFNVIRVVPSKFNNEKYRYYYLQPENETNEFSLSILYAEYNGRYKELTLKIDDNNSIIYYHK